jgi:acetylglutamate kinase
MELVLVKISGGLTDDPGALEHLISYVKAAKKAGNAVVLVHGGGKQINELSTKMEVPVQQVAGRRITTPETLQILMYTVAGEINRNLVSELRKKDILSVGLTGADADLTTAHRRKPLNIDGKDIDFQLVGEIDAVNPDLISTLLSKKYTPVVGCLTWSAEHGMLNINADTFAIKLASALKCSELVMLMEPTAVLDAHMQPIEMMRIADRDTGLNEGWIKDGMIPKLHTGFQALDSGISKVRLTNPAGLSSGKGTILVK